MSKTAIIEIKGQQVLVSLEDLALVTPHKWGLTMGGGKHRSGPYPKTTIDGKWVGMHRLIMNAKPGEIVDHINRNTLDNRRENLRIATRSENRINSKNTVGKHGLPRHIHWKIPGQQYRVEIKRNHKRVCFKVFTDLHKAIAYRDGVLRGLEWDV